MAIRIRNTAAPLLASVLLVSACSTVNPYTGEKQMSKATKGAMIGAAAGALAGVISGDDSRERRRRALIGAGIGGLAGGGIGYYMDVQAEKLRQQLAGTGVQIERQGDNIVLAMPGNVTFATNSYNINSNFYPVLNSVGLVLDEYDKTLVEIAGHTDSTGSDSINIPLSKQRASSVASYLEGRGLVRDRLATMGVGSDYPIASNDTDSGRQQNRRVEITLVPLRADG